MNRIVARQAVPAPLPHGGTASGLRISPDGRSVAYSITGTDEDGVFVAPVDGSAAPRRVLSFDDFRAEGLCWSPDSESIAYGRLDMTTEPASSLGVGWVSRDGSREAGMAPGMTFCFTPKGKALIVADPHGGAISRVDLAKGKAKKLTDLRDDGDPQFPPQLAMSPDGTRFVYTARHVEEDFCEVWVVAKQEKDTEATMFTEVPGGAVFVLPFWSPQGVSLGLHIIHAERERTAMILVARLEGEGQIVYQNPLLDPGRVPLWGPSGKSILLYSTPSGRSEMDKTGPAALSILDLSKGPMQTPEALTEPGELDGGLHFLSDRTIAVDGGSVGHVLTLASAV